MIEIDKCYYLNLDSRTDRRAFIEKEIQKSKLLSKISERFAAINGKTIHPKDIPGKLLSERAKKDILLDTIKAWGLSITQGALGVYLSYIEIFKKIKEQKQICLILEDDSHLSENFDEELLKVQKELPENFDICYLGYGENFIESEEYSKHLVVPTGKLTCLPATIVSPSGAEKLIKLLEKVTSQIDTEIYTKRKYLNIFALKNKIVDIKNNMGTDIQGNYNCEKKYKKQNYIFSTLAHGDIANTNALKLAMDLNHFDQKLLVVTNKPGFFSKMKNVIEVNYPSDYFSYNKKIICFEEGLKLEDAVVYIDSDSRIFFQDFEQAFTNFFINIPPGFHSSWEWGGVENFLSGKDVSSRIAGYDKLAQSLCKDLNIDTAQARHWQEGILALSKDDGKEKALIETWQHISSRLDKFEIENKSQQIGLGEGNIIGLSVVKSGIKKCGPAICNLLGRDLFYNFWSVDKKLHPTRKVVTTTECKTLIEKSTNVDFENKKIDLNFKISENEEGLLILNFKWNEKNLVEYLDHEFKIKDTIYHFGSEKINELIISEKIEDLEIYHTYDWYGERDWKLILGKEEMENKTLNQMEGLEIHSLVCHKDARLAINCIESLIKYEEFSETPIYFHDDGSLTQEDISILKSVSKNIHIIDRKTADEEIKKHILNHPHCMKYRLGEKKDVYLWHKIKSFDYFFFSKTKKILGLDTDLLFLNKPNELIEFIKNGTPCYFPDIQSAYSFNEPKNEIPTIKNVNTGIIHIPSEEYYHLDSIEKALSNLIKNEINYFPSWIEQSAFAHMFYADGRYKSLDINKNRIPFFQNVDAKKAECLHFVSFPDVRKLYKQYSLKIESEKSESSMISEEETLVNFKDKKIPLKLKIYKSEKFYEFEFEWGIESAGITALSHEFKIIKQDGTETFHEFGSSASGFFITNVEIENSKLYHTYDWYGEKEWKEINIKL